jgi:hypothetical protein
VPELVWTQRLEEKSSASVLDQTLAVQSIVRHYTELTTQKKLLQTKLINIKNIYSGIKILRKVTGNTEAQNGNGRTSYE